MTPLISVNFVSLINRKPLDLMATNYICTLDMITLLLIQCSAPVVYSERCFWAGTQPGHVQKLLSKTGNKFFLCLKLSK